MQKEKVAKYKDQRVLLTFSVQKERVSKNGGSQMIINSAAWNKSVGIVKGVFDSFIVFEIGGEAEIIIKYGDINAIELIPTKIHGVIKSKILNRN